MTKAIITLLSGALLWGLGNALTGFTAAKYAAHDSLLPAIDIALANTIGGLSFLWLIEVALYRKVVAQKGLRTTDVGLAGFFKGLNTCLFVFSATYSAATKSLIFESTYVVWSVIFSFWFLKKRVRPAAATIRAGCLLTGVFLLASDGLRLELSRGVFWGLSAGFTYAAFLAVWSHVTDRLSTPRQSVQATTRLLLFSLATILIVSFVLALIVRRAIWIPFAALAVGDTVLQTVNGALVVGLVYLIVTSGMAALRTAGESSSVIASVCLVFSIPFTLLPEYIVGKFLPTSEQLVGMALFCVAFVLLSIELSRASRPPEVSI